MHYEQEEKEDLCTISETKSMEMNNNIDEDKEDKKEKITKIDNQYMQMLNSLGIINEQKKASNRYTCVHRLFLFV
jgi:hypothetical protein